jgi:hypothetical protein
MWAVALPVVNIAAAQSIAMTGASRLTLGALIGMSTNAILERSVP